MKLEARRRLSDLYSRGELISIDDGTGEPISLWVRKMTPADAELAYLKASAKRASFLAMGKQDPPSDAYIALRSQIDEFSKENLVLWLTASEMAKREALVIARTAGHETWSKERYLESLQERALEESFVQKETELPEDEEVVRVRGELDRFAEAVEKALEKERREIETDNNLLPIAELGDMMLQGMLESQADQEWLTEFQKCQIWRCVFDGENHSERVFQTREGVDDLQVEVVQRLGAAIDRVHVPDAEGKDSQQTPDSSVPSD